MFHELAQLLVESRDLDNEIDELLQVEVLLHLNCAMDRVADPVPEIFFRVIYFSFNIGSGLELNLTNLDPNPCKRNCTSLTTYILLQ